MWKKQFVHQESRMIMEAALQLNVLTKVAEIGLANSDWTALSFCLEPRFVRSLSEEEFLDGIRRIPAKPFLSANCKCHTWNVKHEEAEEVRRRFWRTTVGAAQLFM